MKLETVSQGVVAGSIPLFAGHPAPDLLPIAGIQRTLEAAWPRRNVARLFNYGDEPGNAQLLEFLRERLNREERLGIDRENLMIVGGSTWAVNMIAAQLTVAGDAVLVDAPSYRDALHIFRDYQLELHAVPIDGGGASVAEMEKVLRALAAEGRAPKFYYVVPNFQNPTGITMPEARRHAILDLSRRYGFTIVEDDVYFDIRFGVTLPPSFYALGGGENVLRIGSFSKTLAPGLRLGWLIAKPARIAAFVHSGMLRMGGGANPFTAAVVADYCRSGQWEKHVAWLRGQYKARRDVALAELEETMPAAVQWTQPDGGYFIWLTLPRSLQVAALAQRAQQRNVYFAPGPDFFVEPAAGAQHLRLSYSFLPLADLRAGIKILAELIGKLLD